MNRHDCALLTIRGFAIYAWYCGFQYLTNVTFGFLFGITFIHNANFAGLNIPDLFLPPTLDFLVGLFLFAKSETLASKLLPARAGEPAQPSPPPHPLSTASIAFGVLGAALFLYALPQVVMQSIAIINTTEAVEHARLVYNNTPRIIGELVQMAFGYALFLKSRVFAAAWWRKQERSENQL